MRKTYLDNIRWITVILVIIYHVIFMFNGVTTYGVIGPFSDFQPQDVFQYIVYPWFMFLLFVVSGMSARFEITAKEEKEFIRTRTRKYLVPSTIGLLVFGWVLGYYNMLISGALDQLSAVPKPILFMIMCVSGTGPLWYIQLLWFFSILIVYIRKIEKDKFFNICKKTNIIILFLMTLVVYGSAQILNTPIIIVYRFGIYGVAFLVGYFVFSHDEVMDKLEKQWILWAILGVVSGITFVIMKWGQSYPDHEVLDTFICNVYVWFGTLAVLSFMKKWGGFDNTVTKWMRQKSWGLYIFHYLPLAVSSWYLTRLCPTLPAFIVYLAVAASGFVGSLVLDAIIRRIPFIRWCVLGISRKGK